MKKIVCVIILLLAVNAHSYTRVFYEDYENTTFTEHFLENQCGS